MTPGRLRARLLALEDRAKAAKPDPVPVTVTVTRRIVGSDGQTVDAVRRTFYLYPEALTGRRAK